LSKVVKARYYRKMTAMSERVLFAFCVLALSACAMRGSLDERLLKTATTGSARQIHLLISQGAHVDTLDDDGWTPLLWASAHGNEGTVGALIDAGANKDAVTRRESQGALTLAAKWNRVEVVKVLMKRGLSVRQRDDIGWTPLMWAALKGRTDVCAALLDGGAVLETVDTDGNRPLILAARQGRLDTVKLLLARGARRDPRNRDGDTAESLARTNGYHDIADLIAHP
jgi:ankyrin repeat protein